MKTLIAAIGLACLVAAPAQAQTATEVLTNAASQAATDAVTKSLGVKDAKGKTSDKSGPNYGSSTEHRQDGDHRQDGKDNDKKKKMKKKMKD